jgi:hypothetical protein
MTKNLDSLHPASVRTPAKKFKFRANKLMETAIIEGGQDLGRCPSVDRAYPEGADYNPGPGLESN